MELLPSYQELKSYLPLSPHQHAFIQQSRKSVRAILDGLDSRILLILGPCSIHDITSAKEYATQLKRLIQQVSSQFYIVMRVYCEKPRTTAGWKGFLYDPDLDGSNDIQTGIKKTRQLLLDLADMQIPAATEFLDPLTTFYYDDLITWGSIGARTSSSQTHRQLASSLTMPIGFKNGVAGNISAAVNGVFSAASPHAYTGLNENGELAVRRTEGNSDAHVVLRGGDTGPNYDPATVADVLARLQSVGLPQRLIIDCSHQNSDKKYDRQPHVFQSVLYQILEGNTAIRGLMIESHLQAGSQSLMIGNQQLKYGVSITDGCLDWASTEHLVLWGNVLLSQNHAYLDEFQPSYKLS